MPKVETDRLGWRDGRLFGRRLRWPTTLAKWKGWMAKRFIAGATHRRESAAIEDLQARYLFAMDFGDPDLYVTTFTDDGILDVRSGEIKGRKAIHDVIAKRSRRVGLQR